MILDFFNRFINLVGRMFRAHKKAVNELTPEASPAEKSFEAHETSKDLLPHFQTPPTEQISPISTEEKQVSEEVSIFANEPTPETTPTETLPKPYIKNIFPKEKESNAPKKTMSQSGQPNLERKKAVYLGDAKRRQRNLAAVQRPSPNAGIADEKASDNMSEDKTFAINISSPFIEINLDDTAICLVIPRQKLRLNSESQILGELSYLFELNGEEQNINIKTKTDKSGNIFLEERIIPLPEPLQDFQVAYPDELYTGPRGYKHANNDLYVFVAIGNNRGRMHYLYDEKDCDESYFGGHRLSSC